MIKRREFLKGLAVMIAAPIVMKTEVLTGLYSVIPHAEALEHFNGFELGKDIELIELGVSRAGIDREYEVLVYQLKKKCRGGDLEAYCEIDKALIDMVPNPRDFIRSELMNFVEEMRQEYKNRKLI